MSKDWLEMNIKSNFDLLTRLCPFLHLIELKIYDYNHIKNYYIYYTDTNTIIIYENWRRMP